MSIEDLLIAHALIARLTPCQVDELADLLDHLHAPASPPVPTRLPLRDLRKAVVVEFGECRAAEQLTRLIQVNTLAATTPPERVNDIH